MEQTSYLQWLGQATPTSWWHDSADPAELDRALAHGAVGVTTNPYLTNLSVRAHPEHWLPQVQPAYSDKTPPEERAQQWIGVVVRETAEKLRPVFERTGGKQGYVCAQVNPSQAGNREVMMAMARRFNTLGPNIAVKLPATAAGLDVLEECAAEGITVTATVSFTVPQVVAVAERYRRGLARARRDGVKTGRCFAVIMIGRLDDYLRDVAGDLRANVTEADIRLAGLAVTKRAYSIYQACGYEATLLIAALRGTHHLLELVEGDVVMSIAPPWQKALLEPGVARERRIDAPVAADAIARLQAIPDFVRAYEPDGMKPDEFVSYGLTQRTLTQFVEAGWRLLETFRPA